MAEPRPAPRARKAPITRERIVETAFTLIERDGFDALTMRRVAAALDTGAASLYAHVRNKADLDDLLIGELCGRISLPQPDPRQWRAQAVSVLAQLRDQYRRYPGVSRAALSAAPRSIETARLTEGLLGILLAGGVPPRDAAWIIDAALLYVAAYSLESALRGQTPDRPTDLADRLRALPAEEFPLTTAHAAELTSGEGDQRFDDTLARLLATP